MKKSIYKYELLREKVMELKEPDGIMCPERIYEFSKKLNLHKKEQETVIAIVLNPPANIKAYYTVSIGLADRSVIHPREVFRNAIIEGATEIILVHNHPSGNTTPSQADIKITKQLVKAGEIVGIELKDHIIIGKGFYSFKANKMI